MRLSAHSYRSSWLFLPLKSISVVALAGLLSYACKNQDKAEGDGNVAKPSPTSGNLGASGAAQVPTVPYPNQSAATVDPNGCSSAGCQKAAIEISVNGNSARRIEVTAGTPLTLAFTAKATNFPTRQITVFRVQAVPQPQSLQITGNASANVQVVWNATKNDPANGDIQVSARDVTACNAAKASAPQTNCDDFNAANPSWDDTQSFQWNLQGGQNNVGGIGGSSSGNLVLAAGLGTIIGLLQGQTLPGAIGTGLGVVIGPLVGGGLSNGIMYPAGTMGGVYPIGGVSGVGGIPGGYVAQNCQIYSAPYLCQNAGCQWNYNQCVSLNGLYPNGIPAQYPVYTAYPPYSYPGYPNQGTAGVDPYNCRSYFQQFQCQLPNCIWNGSACFPVGAAGGNQSCINIQAPALCSQTPGCSWNGSFCQ